MYNSNPTFPVEFSSCQGFFNIKSLLIWAKRVLSAEVCGSLRRLGVLGTSNKTKRSHTQLDSRKQVIAF